MKRKGVWWLSPSLLEPVDGPWGRLDDAGADPVAAWERILDWAAAVRLDTIVTGVEPYGTDRILGQWPFHYLCRFPDDPAARCFGSVEENIAIASAIAEKAAERSIDLMLHHYNFIAPEAWVDSHPELSARLDAVEDAMWGRRFHVDRNDSLVAHVCWSSKAYQGFMERCWRELLANVPRLAGLATTAGEFSYCRCPACAGDGPENIFEDHDDLTEQDPQLRTKAHFVGAFQKAMGDLGRRAIVRAWGMEAAANLLDPDGEYAVKSAVFDACWVGPDPGAEQWLKPGRKVWMTAAIESENSGPLVWHDPKWCAHDAAMLNAQPSFGTMVHLNVHWGHVGQIASFVSSRNQTRLLERLEPQANKAGDSRQEFAAFFAGADDGAIAEASEAIAAFPLRMTEIVHLKREGFTFHLPPWFDGAWRWPGVFGDERTDPPDWANPRGLVVLTRLMADAVARPGEVEVVLATPGTVITAIDELIGAADRAVASLARCGEPRSSAARAELTWLGLSARIMSHATREYAALLRARVVWEAAKQADVSGDAREALRARTADLFAESITHLRAQLGPSHRIASRWLDYLPHVVQAGDVFYRFPITRRIAFREEELRRIRTCDLDHATEALHFTHEWTRPTPEPA